MTTRRILSADAPLLSSAKSALAQGAQEPAKHVDFLFVQLKQQREGMDKDKLAIDFLRTTRRHG